MERPSGQADGRIVRLGISLDNAKPVTKQLLASSNRFCLQSGKSAIRIPALQI